MTASQQLGENSFQKLYAIYSDASRKAYMRLDGTGVSQPAAYGEGTVNCQYWSYPGDIGPFEKVIAHEIFNDGVDTKHFAIESAAFPGCFLRVDGTGLSQQGQKAKADLQFYENGAIPPEGSWELFKLVSTNLGVAWESVHFPNVYVYLDVADVTATTQVGSGHVYGYYYSSTTNMDKNTSLWFLLL